MTQKVISGAEDIRRILARISHEILERNQPSVELAFIGMRTRGVPLAQRLAMNIKQFEGIATPVGALDFSLYRDDLARSGPVAVVRTTDIPFSVDNKAIILVDDVIFTGRSARAAMDALTDLGRPASIQLAVLVDRGHRELPIRPDYVGKNIPSSKDERVIVHLSEIDDADEIIIASPEEVGEAI